MNPSDPTGFGKFVPGFEFMQSLTKGDTSSMAGWVAPTLDPQALDKRIQELKAVQFWLDQNAAALKATLQALEVQKMTLATLKSMNMSMPGAAPPAAAAGGGKSAAPQAGKPAAGAVAPDPMQFWTALSSQFQQIAADTMKNAAAHAATVSATSPASASTVKPATKSTAKADKPAPAAAKRARTAGKVAKRSS